MELSSFFIGLAVAAIPAAMMLCTSCADGGKEQPRTISVKGIGNASVKPDAIEINMSLESVDKDYSAAVKQNDEKVAKLKKALDESGVDSELLKTTNLNIYPQNNGYNDHGVWKERFVGYHCVQDVKIQFDFSAEHINKVMGAISKCEATPNLSIRFKVKNPDAVKDSVLALATQNARQKAEVLCQAAGCKLGELVTVSYKINPAEIVSVTNYNMRAAKMESAEEADMAVGAAMTPDDIKVRDEATFVWKIK